MSRKRDKRNSLMLRILFFSIVILTSSIIYASTSRISETEKIETKKAAASLIEANFDTITYFKIAQLPSVSQYDEKEYKEGIVPCKTDIFKNYSELERFINSTYISSTAKMILDSSVNKKPRYFDKNGVLYKTIANNDTTYDKDFSYYKYELKNIKETSADIFVIVNKKNSSEKAILKLSMKKVNNKWYLNDFVY